MNFLIVKNIAPTCMNSRVYTDDVVYICCISIISLMLGCMISSLCSMKEYRDQKKEIERVKNSLSIVERYAVVKGYADYVMEDDVITIKWK